MRDGVCSDELQTTLGYVLGEPLPPLLQGMQADGWVHADAQGRWCLTPSGRDRSLHLLAAAKAHEGDLLSRWSYDEGALLKLQLQKFIAATNPGLTDLWHEA